MAQETEFKTVPEIVCHWLQKADLLDKLIKLSPLHSETFFGLSARKLQLDECIADIAILYPNAVIEAKKQIKYQTATK